MTDIIFEEFPHNKSKMYIKMSGGVDSSLLAYCIAKHVIDNNIKVSLHPMIIIEPSAPFQELFATKIIKIVEDLLNIKFSKPVVYNLGVGENKIQKMRSIEKSLMDDKTVIASGTTQYPRDPEFNVPGGPEDLRIGVFPVLWEENIFTPFINLDKREIAEIYKKHDLMQTLLPHTRSCVFETNNFEQVCGECWWCKERAWAFGLR